MARLNRSTPSARPQFAHALGASLLTHAGHSSGKVGLLGVPDFSHRILGHFIARLCYSPQQVGATSVHHPLAVEVGGAVLSGGADRRPV